MCVNKSKVSKQNVNANANVNVRARIIVFTVYNIQIIRLYHIVTLLINVEFSSMYL